MLTPKKLKRNNIILFASIFSVIFIYPFMPKFTDYPFFKILTISLIILSSISALDFGKKTHLALIIGGIPTLLIFWSVFFVNSKYLELTSLILLIAFMSHALTNYDFAYIQI